MIDFVVTWVDGEDPVWREKKAKYTGTPIVKNVDDHRYRDWDTLKYWFRGVEKFAPWVRYVYFVTDDQKPEWLNLKCPKLKWIKHTDYIPEEYLPTFNSHTIEWNLHRIPGLSEQFVYFNDDMFLIAPTKPEDFFVDGLPCDCPRLSGIAPGGMFEYILFNNAVLINKHFSMRESMKQHWKKWVKYQPIKELIKLVWYGRSDVVPGTYNYHVHAPYRKETFQTLWEKEEALIHDTCMHKVRTKEDISHFSARDWRNFSGAFYPKKPFGRGFAPQELDQNHAIADYFRKQKGKVICINDNEYEENFEAHKKLIVDLFEEILPEKSSFEC